jgi:hypothetical protein
MWIDVQVNRQTFSSALSQILLDCNTLQYNLISPASLLLYSLLGMCIWKLTPLPMPWRGQCQYKHAPTWTNLNQLYPTVPATIQRYRDPWWSPQVLTACTVTPNCIIPRLREIEKSSIMQLKNVETPLWLPVSGLYRHIQYNYTV